MRADADIWLPNENNNFSPLSFSPLSSRLSPFSTRSSSPREGIIFVNLYKKFTCVELDRLPASFTQGKPRGQEKGRLTGRPKGRGKVKAGEKIKNRI